MKVLKSIGTHDGSFHADEVSACALLIVFGLAEKDKIFRTRDLKVLNDCEFVCDVGGIYDPSKKLFDHHQAEYQGSLSSAGMVLEYLLKTGVLKEEEYDHLNSSFVLGVDYHDNGIDLNIKGVCTYSQLISNFIPIHHEASSEEMNEAFYKALDLALFHIEQLIKRFRYIRSFKETIKAAMETQTSLLVFDKAIPWMDCFFELGGENHPAEFLIMPSGKKWKLRGIPPNLSEKMKVRTPLPKQWAGLLEKDLQEKTGIKGAIFCHKGQFFSLWETKEDALNAYQLMGRIK